MSSIKFQLTVLMVVPSEFLVIAQPGDIFGNHLYTRNQSFWECRHRPQTNRRRRLQKHFCLRRINRFYRPFECNLFITKIVDDFLPVLPPLAIGPTKRIIKADKAQSTKNLKDAIEQVEESTSTVHFESIKKITTRAGRDKQTIIINWTSISIKWGSSIFQPAASHLAEASRIRPTAESGKNLQREWFFGGFDFPGWPVMMILLKSQNYSALS